LLAGSPLCFDTVWFRTRHTLRPSSWISELDPTWRWSDQGQNVVQLFVEVESNVANHDYT
jgi:hypothetical protein